MKITFWIATKIINSNRRKFLYEAIDSVLAQTNDNWELIISNDNSTLDVDWDKYKENDKIKIFHQEKSLWIFKNFNFCLEKANTDLFLPLWDDDLLQDDFVEKVLLYYENNKNKNLDMITFNFYCIKSNWEIYLNSNINTDIFLKWIDSLNHFINKMYTYKWVMEMFFCSIVKRESLLKIWWYPDFWMVTDWLLVYLFSVNFNIWFIDSYILKIRHHIDNLWWIIKADILRSEEIVLYEYLEKTYLNLLSNDNKDLFYKKKATLINDHVYLLMKFKKMWRLVWVKFFFQNKFNLRKIVILLFWIIFWKNIHKYFIIFTKFSDSIKFSYISLLNKKNNEK